MGPLADSETRRNGTRLRRAERDGSRFLNPVPTTVGEWSTLRKALPLYFSNKEEKVPARPLGPFRTDAAIYHTAPESGLRVTWMGHSSMLVEIDGVNLLIDPVWDERASPVRWMGPKRFFPAPLKLEELPTIDVVVVSHDHYDHLGESTTRPLGGGGAMKKRGWFISLVGGKFLEKYGT